MSERPKDDPRNKRKLRSFEHLREATTDEETPPSGESEQMPAASAAIEQEAQAQEQKSGSAVSLTSPELGVAFSGEITPAIAQQRLAPQIKEALIKSGMDKKDADTLIQNSFMRTVRETKDDTLNSRLQTVLANLAYTARKNNISARQQPQPTSQRSTETPKQPQSETMQELEKLEEKFNADNWEGLTIHGSDRDQGTKIDTANQLARTPSPDSVSQKTVEPVYLGSKDEGRQQQQMDRLVKRTKTYAKESGHTLTQMRETDSGYREARANINLIRKRLDRIVQEGKTEEKTAEVQKLRDELAQNFKTLRAFSKNTPPEQASKEKILEQPKTEDSKEGGDLVPRMWHAKGEASYDEETLRAMGLKPFEKQEGELGETWNAEAVAASSLDDETTHLLKGEAVTETTKEDAVIEKGSETVPRGFEIRSEIRERFSDWRGKKKAYEEAYAVYLQEQKKLGNRLSSFFKKEKQPQKLRDLEAAYMQASKQYSDTLETTLKKGYTENELPAHSKVLRPMLVKHLIVRAIEQKIALENQHALEGRAKMAFEKAQEIVKKYRTPLKILGYTVAIGAGIASGSLVAALLGKTASVKAMTLGAAAGTFGAKVGYDALILDRHAERKESAFTEANRTYSTENFEKLRRTLEERQKKYNSALENREYAIAAGALAGGILGSMAVGSVDIPDVPDISPEGEPQSPELEQPTPDRTETPSPDEVERLEESPHERIKNEPNAPELQEQTEKLENIPKGDDYEMNTPGVIEESEDGEYIPTEDESGDEIHETSEILFTFEPGDKINTVSEALFETWKESPDVLDETLNKKEFLAEMYSAMAEIEKYPYTHAELLEEMGITSGDIDEVQVGQTINLQPFFEYLQEKH